MSSRNKIILKTVTSSIRNSKNRREEKITVKDTIERKLLKEKGSCIKTKDMYNAKPEKFLKKFLME